jgi:iron complex outermembrane receptor protein
MELKLGTQKIALLCGVLLLAASAYAGPVANREPATMPASTAANSQANSLMASPTSQPVSLSKDDLADAPAAVTVINQDDIARSGFSTIPDLLRLVPGMDVARVNSYTWAVSARGLNDQFEGNLLVLQDGRSLYTPIDGGVWWDSVDYVLQDLDRIEVIRGPGATLWGSNAVNGVVNITTKDARDTQGWLVSGLGGNDDSSLSARYGGKISDDTFYRVYFKGKYDNGFPDTAPTLQQTDTTDDWYSGRGGFRIDKHASDADTFTLQGDLANDQLHEPTAVPMAAPPFSQNTVWNGSTTTGNVLGRWTHRVDQDSDFSLQLYYDYLGVSQGPEFYSQNTLDFDFNDRFKLGDRNEVTWGTGYRAYQTDSNGAYPISLSPSSQFRNLYSLFLQDKIALKPDRLFLTLGSKLERNDFTGFQLEPSARLLWTPDKKNSVWASVSRATQTPSLSSTEIQGTLARFAVPNGAGGFAPAAATITGNPDVDSEKLVAYEVGYRMQPTKRISIDLSTYYNNYSSMQSIETEAAQPGSTVIFPTTFGNGIHGDIYGGEIAANVQVTDQWRLAASYSLLHATFERVPGSTDTASVAEFEGSSPRNQAQLHSYLDITKRVHFNASVYFTGNVAEYNVPAFVSTDLNVMWEPRDRMEVKVGVMNLIDNRHPEFGAEAGGGFADEVPRTFYAQVSYSF